MPKKTTKAIKTGKADVSSPVVLKSLRGEIGKLEKEIKRNLNNKEMEDALEDKIETLEDKVEEAEDSGKLSKSDSKELELSLNRLDDLLD